jgi:hypothetical protein
MGDLDAAGLHLGRCGNGHVEDAVGVGGCEVVGVHALSQAELSAERPLRPLGGVLAFCCGRRLVPWGAVRCRRKSRRSRTFALRRGARAAWRVAASAVDQPGDSRVASRVIQVTRSGTLVHAAWRLRSLDAYRLPGRS